MATYDVSAVGLYILDVLGRAMSAIPAPGQVDFIDEIRLTVAGTAGGTAVDCAKLGLKTRAVGALGDDEKAAFVRATLARHGIDDSAMQALTDVPTSATMLPIPASGERSAWHVRGASDHFSLTPEIERAALDADIVHLGGTGLLNAFDGEPSRRLLAQAKQAGCTTTLDLIVARPEVVELIDPLMPFVDYFIPSIDEARVLTGLDAIEPIADYYLARGAQHCVLTLGSEGSYIAGPEGLREMIPPLADITIVDTTGCGDAYSAGFIAGLSQGWGVVFCAYFASVAAALVAAGLGSDAGIESMEQTLEMANAHYERHTNPS